MILTHILIILALLAYAVASGLFLHAFPQPSKREKIAKAGFITFASASILLTAVIGTSTSYGFYSQMSGLVLIASMSWLTIIGYFVLKMRMLGTFVAPLATLILLFQFFTVPAQNHVGTWERSFFGNLHIILALLGEAFGICAFAVSILFLLQQRALKQKQLNLITAATPPIDKLDRFLMGFLWSGFGFLTLGLITGAIYTQFYLENAQPGIGWKVLWAMAVWLWYLATLLARNIFNQSGRCVAQMSVVGFILLSGTFFGLVSTWGSGL